MPSPSPRSPPCQINREKGYAFAEFTTPEDATACMALDGIVLHGIALRVRRPKDYNPLLAVSALLSAIIVPRACCGLNRPGGWQPMATSHTLGVCNAQVACDGGAGG